MQAIAVMTIVVLVLFAGGSVGESTQPPPPKSRVFEIKSIQTQRQQRNRPYLEFLAVPSLSAGLYELPRGAEDRQQPHTRDEIYYVLEGRAVFDADGEKRKVGPGSVVYVRRGVDHRFGEITEDLSLLVVFTAEPGRGTP